MCGPYADDEHDLWVMSDLTPGLDGKPQRVSSDYVLGISPASTSLAQLTRREPVGRSLDLGTGCGVQALHLARHSDSVVATDVNPRALWITEFNLGLNDVSNVDVRDGSFFEPVHGEGFDLIATNPPFVISPATGERLVYRDSGIPGDRVVEDIVRLAPKHLNPGGWCQILANWSIVSGSSWDERLGGWLDGSCDALVVQREVADPATYVEMWLKDAGLHGGPEYARRYDTWLSWLSEQGIEGIGFGWINLRRVVLDKLDQQARFDRLDQHNVPGLAVRRGAADRSGDRGVGRGHRRERPPLRGRATRVATGRSRRRTPGDPGVPRGRGSRVDRAQATARVPSGAAGRHRRGCLRWSERRRTERCADP